ncbi:tRNA (guanine(10)-N2)-methyltransferase homolog isoform X2 [Vespa velutina]|uniref:tRNA (guanine(10)-N2)-methyltransferase homolog isoform X2 n=1 Tax=Vespa velutina TaxID=202808 RepID=UPI001FB26349|nr:tRNA (guanine(10)-N2)-methyltransferase homolog isoform X2 [Vespa velutina]
MKKYLFWFAHEHINFRLPEMESIFYMFDIKLPSISNRDQPYWIVDISSEKIVHKIASRAVSLRFCLELWANGKNNEELHNNLKTYPIEQIKLYADKEKSFKIIVETFCKHFSQGEKIQKIEIADGQRDLIQKFSLKRRKFIGNTSMDPQLSLIMANQAQIKTGDIVLDPFVGTGSLLVAASHFGGYTLGTDIDFLMLHGRTRPTRIKQKIREKDENVAANMEQYGRSSYYIDVIISDFSYPLWKSDMFIDAIITDPPYGIRESTERIGTMKANPVIEEHQVSTHIPSKVEYGLPQIYKDLLNFAAKHLKITGRLVCWYPIFRDQYSSDQLPIHPCLQLIANSEQVLSNYTSRILLTYEKVKEPQETDDINSICLTDFREKYFALREETRKERRMKKATERAKKKEDWEKSNGESMER